MNAVAQAERVLRDTQRERLEAAWAWLLWPGWFWIPLLAGLMMIEEMKKCRR